MILTISIAPWTERCRGASFKSGFKKPGKDATGTFRAILISGSPGIGKTTAAHLVAKACGYDPLEYNASDARSKKLIEVRLSLFSLVRPQ